MEDDSQYNTKLGSYKDKKLFRVTLFYFILSINNANKVVIEDHSAFII